MDRSKWEYKKLGDICVLLNGYAFKSEKYVDEGIRVMRITNVQKGEIVDDDPKFYPMSSQSEIKRYMLQENDLLISLTGNVGRVGLLQRELLPAALNQRVACLRLKGDSTDLRYLFHLMNSDLFENECIVNSQGIAQKNMSTKWLSDYKLPIPPIDDQQRIVTELDCLNEMIAVKQEQLKEFDKLAQSIFYDMFGDPVANEKKFEKHPFGKIAAFKNGLNFKPVDEGNSVKILGVSDFQDLKEIKSADLLSLKCIKETVDNDYYLKTGDIVIVRSNGSKKLVGRNVLISFEDKNVAYSGFCIRCRLISDDCSPLYLNSVLSTPSMKELMTSGGRGCNIANINQQTLNKLMVPLPPLSLQQQFAEKISAIEAQKELVKQSIAETQKLLDYTMDKYFGYD